MSKIATDLEQSKKLAEILPLESADMVYQSVDDDESFEGSWELLPKEHPLNVGYKDDIPAWSFDALMDSLPPKLIDDATEYTLEIYKNSDKSYFTGYFYKNWFLVASNDKKLIDACVKMVIKLSERNLL